MGSLLNSGSKIYVLNDDFTRAIEVAGAATATYGFARGTTQICYACSKECSPSLTACPTCKAVLFVEPQIVEPASEATTNLSSRKCCPICDARYTASHERCTLCGVELVAEELRGLPRTDQERSDRIEIAWRGGDPVALSNAVAALREAGIRNHVQATSDHLVFELAMPRPKYIVRVFGSDLPKAKELLAKIQDSPFFGNPISPEASESSKVPVIPGKRPWNLAAATVEIWSGEDAGLIQILEDCLRENRIGVRRGGHEPGMMRLSVMQQDEAAAREIVREVREGIPPS